MNGGSQQHSAVRRGALALAAAAFALALPPSAPAQTTYDAADPGGDENTFVSVPPPGRLFGLNDAIVDYANGQGPEAYASYVRNVGGNAVRTTLDWAWAEPVEEDQWAPRRWEVWTDAYDAARARGLTPIFVLTSAPYWAREDPEGSTWCPICPFPPRPEMDEEWAEFVAEVARRFPEAIIQSWNEPNLHYWWGWQQPDPERYAELADVAYDAVQAVEQDLEDERGGNVEIPVIAPGLANVSEETADNPSVRMSLREFLERAYAAPHPLGENMDGLAVNLFPHSVHFGEDTLLAEALEDLREVRAAAGDDSKIYVTETGLPGTHGTSGFPEYDRTISSYRLYNRLTSMEDVAAVLFHRIIEPVENDFGNSFEYGLAWMRYSKPPRPQTQAPAPEPKPVYCLFTQLAGRTYPKCMTATITAGPSARTRKRTATFRFELAPGTWQTALECSLDGAPYAGCATSYSTPRLKRGRHVFRVRALNGVGQVGTPAERAWTIKKKKKKKRRR